MDIDFKDKEEVENPTLSEIVDPDNDIKNLLVEYIGEKHNPEDGNVTVGMIVDTLAEEFPEFVLALAEENWVRGYQQAFYDLRGDLEKKSEQQPS
jgi:hypothetical protein